MQYTHTMEHSLAIKMNDYSYAQQHKWISKKITGSKSSSDTGEYTIYDSIHTEFWKGEK